MSSNFLQHHQPAISPYAPLSRNKFLHLPNTNNNNNRKGVVQKYKKSIALLTIYIVVKYRDSPLLQKVYSNLSYIWKQFILLLSRNETLNKYIVNSEVLTKLRFFLVHNIIITKAVKRLRLEGIIYDDEKVNEQNVNNHNKVMNTGNNEISMQQLKWHGHQIDNILKYWFGQYSPDKAQKHLWMIASSSQEQLIKVDSEITELYSHLLSQLGTNEQMRDLWCGDSCSKCIDNSCDDQNLYGWRGKLAAIILLDQMSRHIHRYNNKTKQYKTNNEISIPSQTVLDNLAFEVSKSFQEHHSLEISSGMIPIPMLIFALMPYRHASTIQTVGFVQSKVEEMANMNSVEMENMIRRFRSATNRRMAVLQDEARREGKKTSYDKDITNCVEDDSNSQVQSRDDYSDDDILEFQPFIADMSDAGNHAIVKTIINFLSRRGIHPLKTNCKQIRDTPVLVSLSGGVDSMVIASVLTFLRDSCNYGQLFLSAVHIDYGNRPESAAEANFVKNYAMNIIKFDDFVLRRIDEVTRGETKRDEYEKISRNVRYDLYKITISKCIKLCTQNDPDHMIKEVGVMLGHHRGDVVENVISNSNKGCGPLDLSGMTEISQNDGVTIYRPLLSLDKVDVYNYSHKYGVPYFKDTTPHWSTRGKLRNKLIPLLEEVYGDGCLNNLAKLAEESDEARDLFNKSAFRPFMDTVVRYPMGIIFSTAPFESQGTYFWKIVLRDLLHKSGLGMFSDKSIESFLVRALADKIKPGWLQCRRDYAVYLMSDGRVMVLVSS